MSLESQCEHKPCILVVDDKPQNLFALKKLLENPVYDVLTAVSGNDALAMALEHDFSVILMDVQMPGMNGFETANLLSLDEATKHIPIIFVTAHHTDAKNISQGYESGAVDFLSKPLNPHILKSKINIFLALHKQRAELEKRNKDLAQTDQSKSEFLEEAGDHLRKPVFRIMGLAKKLLEAGLDEQCKETAAELLEQTDRLISATDALFQYTSNEIKENRIRPKNFNLEHVMTDVDYVLGLRARERQISYRCTRDPHVPPLLVGDSTRLRQIMLTLITTSVKFSNQGDVSVHVDLQEDLEDLIALRFSMKQMGKKGKGGDWLSKALKTLEPFKPVDDKEGFQCPIGPTLGLTVARQMVEAMGGKTGVEKTPDGGLNLWFTALFKKKPLTNLSAGAAPPPKRPAANVCKAKEKSVEPWKNGISESPAGKTLPSPAPFAV